MGTRYSRRSASGSYEYHDSKESVRAAQQEEDSAGRSFFFGFIGLIAGGVLSYVLIQQFGGAELPKALRFAIVIAGGAGTAWLLARLADLIWFTIMSVLALAVLWLIGSAIWEVV